MSPATVLVTGAARGIGRATVHELARRGHRVIATARRPADLDGLPAHQKLRLDVTDADSVGAAFASLDGLDAVVSNAGLTVVGAVESTPPEEWARLFTVNVTGAIRVAQAALPLLRKTSGRLVFVSSLLGHVVVPLFGAYCATRWALEAAAETLAFELRPSGVSVTLVELPAVDTDMNDRAPHYVDERYAPLARRFAAAPVATVPPDQAAAAIADAVDADAVPLRILVGSTEQVLAAMADLPRDRPAVPIPIQW
jgi:NAD(P)-dependent dehydrogenase (short-subunit alcohol dehydrogenase family)